MNDGKCLIEMTKELFKASQINKVDDVIDMALAPLTDYLDTLGDVITPVKSFVSVFSLAKKLKMKAFLKWYADSVNESIDLSNNDFTRMTEYMGNVKNVEFVAEIIDSALNSRATTCSAILGYYAGTILSETKDIEYNDLIVINALKIMVDEDLDNFLVLYDLIMSTPDYRSFKEQHIVSRFEELEERHFNIEMTIEKLKGIQAVGYTVGGPYTPSGWGVFAFNKNTDYLYKIIVKAGVRRS